MRRARALAAGLAPTHVLAAILVLQIAAVAGVAAAAQHDGWMWFQGGDQLWHWTGAWLISDGWLPPTYVGWVWSMLLAPAAAILGPSFVAAAPLYVLVQPLTLVPLATALVYACGSRLGGRWFGAGAAAIWVFAPLVAIPLFVDRYHDRWVDQFLPQLYGLSGLSDLPTTVVVVAAMVATLRALDRPLYFEGALAGALMGLALGLKPSSALFLAAPVTALAVARAWRTAAAFVLGMVPFLLVLAVWKVRGLGELPAFADGTAGRVAAGPDGLLAVNPVDRYLELDWDHLDGNLDQLREFFWSARLLVWIPIAGTIGLFRLSIPKALLVALWFWPYVIAKGTSQLVTVESGSFWRHVMPALPAYALMLAAIALLVPGVAARIRAAEPPAPRQLPQRALALAGAVAFLVPLATIALVRPVDGPRAIQMFEEGTLIPVVDDLRIDATRSGDRLQLRWSRPDTGRSTPFYRLFRSDDDLECFDLGVRHCVLRGEPMDTIADPAHTVPFAPGIYRIGAVVDARRQVGEGETFLLGPPLVVRG